MTIKLSHVDHFVLTVADLVRTCDFYEKTLGMRRDEFKPGRIALYFGRCKINLHPAERVVADRLPQNPTPGSADVCLIAETPVDEIAVHLKACGVKILEGPAERSGAMGPINSVYFFDPDNNLIEISNQL